MGNRNEVAHSVLSQTADHALRFEAGAEISRTRKLPFDGPFTSTSCSELVGCCQLEPMPGSEPDWRICGEQDVIEAQ